MITHPFVGDLSDMTLEELQEKMGELTKHLNFAYRMQNSSMIHQLQMIMSAYQNAHGTKMTEMLNKKYSGDQIKVDQ